MVSSSYACLPSEALYDTTSALQQTYSLGFFLKLMQDNFKKIYCLHLDWFILLLGSAYEEESMFEKIFSA